jgi:hypothetical protein
VAKGDELALHFYASLSFSLLLSAQVFNSASILYPAGEFVTAVMFIMSPTPILAV